MRKCMPEICIYRARVQVIMYCGTSLYSGLTHWDRDKMDSISQTTFSSAFSWMKMFEFRLKFHWSLFLRVQITISQHWFREWLGAVQATSHYLNQWWLVYRRIYASLGLNELNNALHPVQFGAKLLSNLTVVVGQKHQQTLNICIYGYISNEYYFTICGYPIIKWVPNA